MGTRRQFMVERYVAGITEDDVASGAARLRIVVSDMQREGVDVAYLGSTLVPSEGSVFSLFLAPTREGVEEVNHRAGLPFHRIVEAIQVE